MKIIDTVTKSGTTLYGCLYGNVSMKKCVIITNGTAGNIFENKFFQVIGDYLKKNNIAFLCAHNTGAFHIMDLPNKNSKYIRTGFAYEDFNKSYEDLDAWVKTIENMGFKEIVLGGHSLGANKVVNYLSKNKDHIISKYILLSPCDTKYYSESEIADNMKYEKEALINIKENRGDKLLSDLYDDWCTMSSKTLLSYLEKEHLDNLPVFQKDQDFSQLQAIDIKGLYIMGEKDSLAGGNTKEFLNTINDNSKNKNNEVVVLNNTGHTFTGLEKSLAELVYEFSRDK